MSESLAERVGAYSRPSVEERFWSKVKKTETCWLWTGGLTDTGYGQFFPSGRRQVRAHRFAYELLVGPVPEGLFLDHVKARGCRNRHCVNPAHLEPVTNRVNVLRGEGPTAVNALKSHCHRGHPYDADTYITPQGWRRCRICKRASDRVASPHAPAEPLPGPQIEASGEDGALGDEG